MPIKRVVCTICKQEVNKAQTYHVGEGRACKTHQGVSEQKEALEKTKAQKLQEALKRETRRMDNFYRERQEQRGETVPLGPSCWVCKNPGIRSEDFFARILIEQSKAEKIYGTINPFDFNHPGNQFGKNKERCIFVLDKNLCQKAIRVLKGEFISLVEISGVLSICGPCCKTFGIDPLPKVDFEELMNFAAVCEVVVKPVVDKIAESEMAKDN